MNKGRYPFNLVAMNGHLYGIGGVEGSFDKYDPNKKNWTLLKETYFEGLQYASAVVLAV